MAVLHVTINKMGALWQGPPLGVYMTQQNTAHLKRVGFNIRSVWEHKCVIMAESDGEGQNAYSVDPQRQSFWFQEKCHLFAFESSP